MKDCETINALIEEHLKSCSECQKEYEELMEEIAPMPVILPKSEQLNPFKKIKRINRRRNILIILAATVVIFTASLFTFRYINYRNGKTVYCHRNPVMMLETVADSFSTDGNNADIEIVLHEKTGNLLNYNSHAFEIFDANRKRHYTATDEKIGSFDSVYIRITPDIFKKEVPDSINLEIAIKAIKSVLKTVNMDESKLSVCLYSYPQDLNYDVEYYYNALKDTFTDRVRFEEDRVNHRVCLIQLMEPKVEMPYEGVLMGDDLLVKNIAVIY